MTPRVSAEFLRERWHKAQQQTLGEEMLAFSDLAAHPDARWRDLLEGLSRPGMVGEDAWLRLRTAFKEAAAAGASHRDRAYWISILADRGIDPNAKISMQIQRT